MSPLWFDIIIVVGLVACMFFIYILDRWTQRLFILINLNGGNIQAILDIAKDLDARIAEINGDERAFSSEPEESVGRSCSEEARQNYKVKTDNTVKE